MQSVTARRRRAGLPSPRPAQAAHGLAPAQCRSDALIEPIADKVGLEIAPTQRHNLARNLMKLMERHKIEDAGLFLERFNRDAALFDDVIAEMTVGETYFFRDPAQFDFIRKKVLPSLLADRPERAPIRMWSTGCSTGEEAYSLAVLADQMGLADRTQIIATDISRKALEVAREGHYTEHSMRGQAAERIRPHLSRRGNRLRLREKYRRRVRFDQFWLGVDDLPCPAKGIADLDLILCRNVLIYLRPDVVQRIARQFYRCLAPGGWLLLGPSDPPLWDHAPFATFVTRAGILYRRDPSAPGRVAFDRKGAVTVPASDEASPPGEPAMAEEQTVGQRLREAKLALGEDFLARCIQELVGIGALDAAAALVKEAIGVHPLSIRLHYLQSVVLIAADRLHDAAAALRRLLYLDGSLAAAHYLLGTCLRESDPETAGQAFAIAFALCARRPAEEPVELMEEYSTGRLAIRIGREIADLKLSTRDGF